MRAALNCLIAVGLFGCGAFGGPGNPASNAVPTNHPVFSAEYADIGHSAYFEGTFSLPADSTVSYTITDRGAGDTWNVGIAPASELMAFESGRQQWQAYAAHNGVGGISDSVAVPAGDYALALRCTNAFNHCQFTVDLSATY